MAVDSESDSGVSDELLVELTQVSGDVVLFQFQAEHMYLFSQGTMEK
jgi:hypothetical protein